MIVCHCNVITVAEIESVIAELLAADPWVMLTPNKVYHALGKRGKCCGCFPNVIDLMIAAVERMRIEGGERHVWADTTLTHLRLLKSRRTPVSSFNVGGRLRHERQPQGNRTPQ